MSRNRSAEAKAVGMAMKSFILPQDAIDQITEAQQYLRGRMGRATQVQGLIYLIREGAKRLPRRKEENATTKAASTA